MSTLREEWIRILKGKSVKVNGFTGVGTLFEVGGHQVCIIAANEDVLDAMLKEFMPNSEVSGIKFQKMTIIGPQS